MTHDDDMAPDDTRPAETTGHPAHLEPIEGVDVLDVGDLGDTVIAPVEGPFPQAPGATKRLAGATVGMAIGTTLSRITGVGRIVALTAALAGGGFADAYNLANTTPNIVTDIVIGGVLSATFVPVFVANLTMRPAKEAWEAISAVVTATIVLLTVATVAFFVLAPAIISLYTVTNHHADVHLQQQTAVFLLRWFVPQLACYGLIALFAALLNTQGRFAAPMFVPIANNVVVIGVLVWFHLAVPHPSLDAIQTHRGTLVLLGIGTTLGVVVQTILLIPSLLRSGLHLRFRWQPRHEAVRRVARLAGWTFAIVLANQLSLVVVLALADGVSTPGAVSAYTYAYTFFQLPYGIVAVSVMSAVTPSLSARWASGNLAAFRHRMAFGLRSILAIVIPAAAGMIVLAHPLIDLVLAHGAETAAQASTTGSTMAVLCLGLPGFCTLLYMVRVLQAMHDTRTAFRIYLIQNVGNVVLALLLVGPLGVEGLALAFALSYTVAAVVALRVVAARDGGLGGSDLTTPVLRVLAATAVMTVASVLAVSASGATSGLGLLLRVMGTVVVGVVAFAGTTALLAARDARRPPGSGPGDTPRGPGQGMRPDAGRDGSDRSEIGDHGARDKQGAERFRARLSPASNVSVVRHLRPVPDQEAGSDEEIPADQRVGLPHVELPQREDDEEESHGQDPGSHR